MVELPGSISEYRLCPQGNSPFPIGILTNPTFDEQVDNRILLYHTLFIPDFHQTMARLPYCVEFGILFRDAISPMHLDPVCVNGSNRSAYYEVPYQSTYLISRRCKGWGNTMIAATTTIGMVVDGPSTGDDTSLITSSRYY